MMAEPSCPCEFCVWRARIILARDLLFWTGEAALLGGGTLKLFTKSELGGASLLLGMFCLIAWRWLTTTQRQAETRHDLELLKEIVTDLATSLSAGGLRRVASSLHASARADTPPNDE